MNSLQIFGYLFILTGVMIILIISAQVLKQKKLEEEREGTMGRGWTDPTSKSLKIKRKNAPKL